MTFTNVGEVTIEPTSSLIEVGSFSIEEGDDTIWFEVQRTSPDDGWPYSYGILRWRTEFGYELGSIKVYTSTQGEIYKLSVGRAPRSVEGMVLYEPRSYNLQWVKSGKTLKMSFAADSGVTAAVAAPGSVTYTVENKNWEYAPTSGLLRLKL